MLQNTYYESIMKAITISCQSKLSKCRRQTQSTPMCKWEVFQYWHSSIIFLFMKQASGFWLLFGPFVVNKPCIQAESPFKKKSTRPSLPATLTYSKQVINKTGVYPE